MYLALGSIDPRRDSQSDLTSQFESGSAETVFPSVPQIVKLDEELFCIV
ncbi:MAG: hypothetical protein ACP5D4_19765 [Baaleninema sp.]